MGQSNLVGTIISQIAQMDREVDALYDFLPRDDYYRMKQLLTEAEKVMGRHKRLF